MKTGGNFSPHRGADIFRFRPILCLLKRWDYLFRDWNCSYTLKQIDNADKFIRAIEEYMSRIWPAAVHHPFIMSIEYSPLWNSDTHRQRTGNPDVSRGLGFGRCLSSIPTCIHTWSVMCSSHIVATRMVHPKDMHPKSPDVVWAFRFQSAFAARMAYRRYLKLKILEIALRTPFAAQVGLL